MLCDLDGSDGALDGILRPGNAGSNTGSDQTQAVEFALQQLPEGCMEEEILVRYLPGREARHGASLETAQSLRRGADQPARPLWLGAGRSQVQILSPRSGSKSPKRGEGSGVEANRGETLSFAIYRVRRSLGHCSAALGR